MIVARWSIDARFGHKQAVIDSMTRWQHEIGSMIGASDMRLLTASIGREAVVQSETTLESLSELDALWSKLATIDAHRKWSKDLEPYVVSGSPHWEIYRVLLDSK